MKKVLFVFLVLLNSFIIASQKVERRIALVIGNGDYEHGASLKNPVNDANLMASNLEKLGFEVILKTNANLRTMQMAAVDFSRKISGYDLALFYYAGQGIQIDGENYLIPVDAKMEDKLMTRYEAFDINNINIAFQTNQDKMNIMILDACSDNPFRSWMRGESKGFSAIREQAAGTIIAFATREGETASTGNGQYGLFTQALVKQMNINQSITEVFQNTRKEVLNASGNKQCPQEWNMLTGGNFSFKNNISSNQNLKSGIQKFPWPPPKSSAIETVTSKTFSKCKTFFDVDELIELALVKNGYFDKSYYAIMPGDSIKGFAIATRLEQINEDATSKSGENRWKTKVEMNDYTFGEYISSLFFAQTGYFRIIVFIVTDLPVIQSKETVSREVAMEWVSDGVHILPPSIRNMPFTNNHTVTALIYEYKLPENSDKATLLKPSEHSGREHLVKSKLWETLIIK